MGMVGENEMTKPTLMDLMVRFEVWKKYQGFGQTKLG
jgi:acyl-CoA-binding protein